MLWALPPSKSQLSSDQDFFLLIFPWLLTLRKESRLSYEIRLWFHELAKG